MRLALRGRMHRRRNLISVAFRSISSQPTGIPSRFFVKSSYRERGQPHYDDAFGTPGIVWQPRVYTAVAAVATALGSRRVIDVGSGNGAKLAALHPDFELIGIDTGANLTRASEQFPFVRWVQRDLDEADDLGAESDALEGAVLVCADVIEHLKRPDRLLGSLRAALPHSDCILLSTPDRELLWGARHDGPPPNRAHVREWSRPELAAFLGASGFDHGKLMLTQSRSGSPLRNTVLAVLAQNGRALEVAFDAARRAIRVSSEDCA
jgi:SAM-dependent methyltransferase